MVLSMLKLDASRRKSFCRLSNTSTAMELEEEIVGGTEGGTVGGIDVDIEGGIVGGKEEDKEEEEAGKRNEGEVQREEVITARSEGEET